jgi:hypothetical protein
LGNAQKVFDKALEQCGAEFATTVAQGGKSCLPSPAWLLEHVKGLAAGGQGVPELLSPGTTLHADALCSHVCNVVHLKGHVYVFLF